MKISQAVTKSKPLTVPFDGAELQITYRPPSFTVREMEEMQREAAESGNTRRVIASIKEIVQSWDLEDNDENPIPLDTPLEVDEETGKKIPAADDPLLDVPTHIFMAIMKAVNEDQTPSGEVSRPSRGR